MRAFLLLLILLGSCASADRPDAPDGRTYAWVWLLTGPRDAEVQGAERAQAFAGHFSNMGRLADEGVLLLAGPMAEPLARPDHRGVYVLDVPDLETARAVASTDPAVQAGIFVMEVENFRTNAPLDEVPARHEEFVANSGEVNPPMGFHSRPYVLLTGTPAVAAEHALGMTAARILMSGRLTDRDTALFCLDLMEPGPAQAMADSLSEEGVVWTVIPWFATEEVAQLPSLRSQ